jgi:predicted RNA-binding protein with PIN domain
MTDELPAVVRAVIVGWAAETLATLLPAQTPASLARVARFTPAKRPRLGAAALLQAVEVDPGFRAAVAERARRFVDDDQESPDPADPARTAAAAHLLHLPTETELMAAVRAEAPPESRPETESLRALVRRLERDLARVTAERDRAGAQIHSVTAADQEVEKLRKRLREQGTRVRQAELAVQVAEDRNASELLSLRSEVARLTVEVTNWQERARLAADRADRAQESLGRLRERAGQHKATADRRLDLLLSTVEGAVSGLRREWDLAGGGIDPADLVAGRLPGSAAVPESTAEPSRLYAWLGLPAAHLIVDGYNVSKTGYPDLTLAQQRERLVRQLAALSARTSAEVTVVFDGAAVQGRVAVPHGRGVRVRFSEPGRTADDLVRALVRAEPPGRVVVVVSTDREVADGVRAAGARPVPSAALARLLERG